MRSKQGPDDRRQAFVLRAHDGELGVQILPALRAGSWWKPGGRWELHPDRREHGTAVLERRDRSTESGWESDSSAHPRRFRDEDRTLRLAISVGLLLCSAFIGAVLRALHFACERFQALLANTLLCHLPQYTSGSDELQRTSRRVVIVPFSLFLVLRRDICCDPCRGQNVSLIEREPAGNAA